jgi:hypothetical protein
VVILSHSFWRRLFDINPDVVGRSIVLERCEPRNRWRHARGFSAGVVET